MRHCGGDHTKKVRDTLGSAQDPLMVGFLPGRGAEHAVCESESIAFDGPTVYVESNAANYQIGAGRLAERLRREHAEAF